MDLNNYISKFRSQRSQYLIYQNYYDGIHDILSSYSMNDARSNQKVICNFFKKFINDEVSYSIGNPVNYISNVDDKTIVNKIEMEFGHWEKLHNQELLTKALIFGEAYELKYTYYDVMSDSIEFKCTSLTPLNCFIVESDDVEKNVIMAMHFYTNVEKKDGKFLDVSYMDLYHENKIDTYKLEEDTPNSNVYYAKDNIGVDITKPIKSRTHIFGKPPVKVLSANMDRKSLLDDIKSLQDAYNNVISDLVNEVSDFRQALMRVVGAVFEAEDISKMKESGVIQLPPNSEVDYLIKNINDTFVQNLLNSLEEKIYKVSNHIDTNEKLVSNISGVTLRSRLIALESKCSLIQNMMEDLIKNRLKCYFYYLKQTSNALYNYKDIKVKFTANIPADLTGLADVCVKLIPLVSQETLLSLLPFIENPDVELQKFNNEQESKMINLDYVEDGDINEPTTE